MRTLNRFMRFSATGVLSFTLDLALLFLFTEYLKVFYLLSAALSFIIATSVQYLASRSFAFKDSSQSLLKGYLYFLSISLFNLLFTLSLLAFFVEYLHIYYMLARILVASFIGVWNFIINSKLTFKLKPRRRN